MTVDTTDFDALASRARGGDLSALQILRNRGLLGPRTGGRPGYALSHAQRRLWALDRIEPGSAAYNMPGAIRIRQHLRTGRFAAALHALVSRHESLRTTFAVAGGEPRQFVRDLAPAFDEIDLSIETDPESAARELLLADAFAPFDLAAGPLVRCKLLKLDRDDWIVYLNLHHIVGDEWSIGVILRDLMTAYAGDGSLPPLSAQYKDFAARQNAWLRTADAESSGAYWKEKLAGPLARLDLPLDFPRPAERTHHGANHAFSLDGEIGNALSALGRRAGATPFQTLTALTKVLLHRYTGAEDVVVGAPVAGREDFETEEQVGFYVNMLVLRDEVHGEQSFSDVLASVRRTTREAYEHARYPFDLLVGELDVARDLGRTPLFDVAIILQDRGGAPASAALRGEPFDFGYATAKYDLSIYFAEGADGAIDVVLNYSTRLFAAETIARMAGHLEQIARAVAHDADARIDGIEIVTAEERWLLLDVFNDTAAAYPDKTLVELFEEQAAHTPDNVAVVTDAARLTYRELDERANGIAALLPQEMVAVLLEPSELTVAALLGAIKAGGAYVPLDPSYPHERLRFMLEDCGARVLAAEPATLELARAIAGDGVRVIDVSNASPASKPSHGIDSDSVAYVIYTSGSTGTPKGCCVTHRNVVRLLKNDRVPFDFHERDVWVVAHSFCFDFSVWEMYGALLAGASVVVPRREDVRDPDEFLRLLRRHRITVLNQTPAAFYNLIARESESETRDLDAHLRWVIFGGDRLDPARLAPWTERYPLDRIALVNMYGITETTVHVTFGRLTNNDVAAPPGPSPIGVPLPGTTVYVMNAARRLQPIGVPGEIYVGGSGVSAGYLNRPELTAQRFVDNPYRPGERLYRSGDVGCRRADGTLDHRGRNDDQVQVRGFRIEPREIERALASIEGVSAAVVRARDAGGVQELIAWYTGSADPVSLRTQLRQSLPEHMIPAHLVSIDAIPLTSNGKIDAAALPKPGVPSVTLNRVPPRDRLEHALAEVWQLVLGVESLSVHDNYFNAGGDSIKVIRLISAIRAELGARLEVKDIFRHPTIADLAARIRTSGRAAPDGLAAASAEVEAIKESILEDPLCRALLPDDVEDVYPMSDIEQGMIFHNLLETAGGVYHDQFVYPIEHDAFDADLFRRALELLIDKHAIFRTSFHVEGFPQPIQAVHRRVTVELPFEDLSMFDEPAQERLLLDLFARDRAQPFDVTKPGLWRGRLVTLSATRHALLWSVQHAILDGWSNASFFTELLTTYRRLIDDPGARVDPLRASYRDFVIDQLRWRRSPEVEESWKRELDGWEHMGIPFGRAVDPGQPRGTRRDVTRKLDPSLGTALLTLARNENVPVREVYLAAFAALMELATGKNDLLFGIVSNNRPPIEDGDAILGCFLNSLPFRVALPFPRTPRQAVRAVSQKLRQLQTRDGLSMRRIAELHGVAGETAPFFDVLFNFVDFHVLEQLDAAPAADRPVLVHESTNTLFDFSVSGTFGAFSTTVSYMDALLSESEVERINAWYLQIIQRFAAHADEPLTNDFVLDELRGFNDVARDYPRDSTIAEVFEEQVRRTPDAIAVSAGGRQLTYAELDELANRLAATLPIAPEECVAVLLDRSEWTVVSMLAILKAGGAYVPLDPEWPRQRIEYVIRDTRCRFALTDREIEGLECRPPACSLPPPTKGRPEAYTTRPPGRLAYVNYTSGSTGRPKGSLIEQRSVLRLVLNTNYVDVREDDRILQAGSVAFDACTFEIWGALLNGGCVVLPEQGVLLDTERFARLLVDERITILFLTTSLFNQFAEADAAMFRGLRLLLTGGEKASPRHFALVAEACPAVELQHVYGPTENTTFSTFWRVDRVDGDPPIGIPIANSTVHLLDRNLQPVPVGVPGEICTGGDGVARGYLNDPAATARKFVDDPFAKNGRLYRTGDLGRRRADGAIEFIGRIDRQVKVRGFRVEPGEIEQQLLDHPCVAQAVVITRKTSVGTLELIAYYTRRRPIEPDALREHLARFLPPFMVPSHLVPLVSMPLSPTGKIDRAALPPVREEQTAASGSMPRDGRESILATIWSEVLGRERVGIDENYFQLGGDSIRAIQIKSRLDRAGWRMNIRDLFLTPTIAGLAPSLVPAAAAVDQSAVTGRVPLTPIQQWFLREHRGDLHHFVQPALLRSRLRLDADALRNALQRLADHHDQLRAVLPGEQIVREPGRPVPFELVECDAAHMRAHSEQLMSSFDLKEGPLFRAALYRLEDGDRLLLAAHHLVVDGVSWRILAEDLERAYQSQPLPPKTHSFAAWAEHLARNADSFAGERAYWEALAAPPADHENRYRDCRSIDAELPAAETAELIRSADVTAVLLTALGRAFGGGTTQVMLERHGRSPLASELDVSRTVGWFTSMAPFAIELRGRDPARQIEYVSSALRAVPRDGIGYGVLRYLANEPLGPAPRISFNYLGQFGGGSASLFTFSAETIGRAVSPSLTRVNDLDVDALVLDGTLRIAATYDVLRFDASEVSALMDRFLAELRAIAGRPRGVDADDLDAITRSFS